MKIADLLKELSDKTVVELRRQIANARSVVPAIPPGFYKAYLEQLDSAWADQPPERSASDLAALPPTAGLCTSACKEPRAASKPDNTSTRSQGWQTI